MSSSGSIIRIDRFLFFTRFYKTRVLATEAVNAGHVRLNGERTSPGARVKVGDRVDLVRQRLPYAFEITAIPTRRGPAKEARLCLEEFDDVVCQRVKLAAALKQDRMLMPKTAGRPDKHTRRKLRERNRGE